MILFYFELLNPSHASLPCLVSNLAKYQVHNFQLQILVLLIMNKLANKVVCMYTSLILITKVWDVSLLKSDLLNVLNVFQ